MDFVAISRGTTQIELAPTLYDLIKSLIYSYVAEDKNSLESECKFTFEPTIVDFAGEYPYLITKKDLSVGDRMLLNQQEGKFYQKYGHLMGEYKLLISKDKNNSLVMTLIQIETDAILNLVMID